MAFLHNEFLMGLRELQQDGRGAIVLPTDWLNAPPLLEVRTRLDDVVDAIAGALRADTGRAVWHFFIGSPGNGKSAAAGRLVRQLAGMEWTFTDEDKTPLEDLPGDEIPYVLHARPPGAQYATCWIAQDVSVVRDPYSTDLDPVIEFRELLEAASRRGVSLIVCSNRGVIEALHARYASQYAFNSTPWFQAVNAALSQTPRDLAFGGRVQHALAHCDSTTLDRRSLVIGEDTLMRVIQRATEAGWDVCEACDAAGRCPFFQNRNWLRTPELQSGFLKVLQRAEVLSGRVLVFREALALLSLILTGCPHDAGSNSPCEWVHAAIQRDDIFLLISRRIYAILYSAYSPFSLETHEDLFKQQLSALQSLAEAAGESALVETLRKNKALSTDVGLPSLLGHDGVMTELDPFTTPIPIEKIQEWDSDAAFIDQSRGGCELERSAVNIWNRLSEAVEQRSTFGADTTGWLERWATSFSHRAAALAEGYTAFAEELDELLTFLSAERDDDPSVLRHRDQLERSLQAAIMACSAGVQIAPFAELSGEWVDRKLTVEVRVLGSEQASHWCLPIVIGQEVNISLSGRAYVWLRYRDRSNLSLLSFPTEYLKSARDSLARAAAEGHYFDAERGVILKVKRPDGSSVSLRRVGGAVFI
jgi:hypothetical protein